MMEMAEPMSPHLSSSPSFNAYSAANRLERIAARVISELAAADEESDDLFPVLDQVRQSKDEEGEVVAEQSESKEGGAEEGHECGSDSDSDDFEFAVVCRDSDASPMSADELFSNGQIRPIFPIFNRDLIFHHEEDTSSSAAAASGGDGAKSEARRVSVRLPLRKLMIEDRDREKSTRSPPSSNNNELEGLPEGSYCVWTPRSVPQSPERCKKSKSTGSSSKRWRFRDLLHRSSSDGKDTFVFLAPGATGRKDRKPQNSKDRIGSSNDEAGKSRPRKSVEMAPGAITAGGAPASPHQMHYIRNRAIKEGDRRRSFLPYRQDIVGFFANVNGLSRTVQPF